MIVSARDMRNTATKNKHYEKGYKQAVDSVMKSIIRASELNLRRTCFCPQSYYYKDENGMDRRIDFDDEVKKEFEKHGYTFKPTGYANGVWQQSEDICW